MSYKYQNQRNWTGQRGSGGFRGHNRGRGRGGWHQGKQGASSRPPSGDWQSKGPNNENLHRQQRNSQGPSTSGQQWQGKGPDSRWHQGQQGASRPPTGDWHGEEPYNERHHRQQRNFQGPATSDQQWQGKGPNSRWHQGQQGASRPPSGEWHSEEPDERHHRPQRNSQGPSPSGQGKEADSGWHQGQQRITQGQQPPGHVYNHGSSGSWTEEKKSFPVENKDTTRQWDQKSRQRNPQTPFQPNVDGQSQGQFAEQRGSSRFQTDQPFMQKPFVPQQNQVTSQQSVQMPSFTQNPPPPPIQGYPGMNLQETDHSSQMSKQMPIHQDPVPGQHKLLEQPNVSHQSQFGQGQPHAYQPVPDRTQQNVQPFASGKPGNNQIPPPLPNRTQNVQPFAPFAPKNLGSNQIPQPLPNRTQHNVQPFASENLGSNQIHQPLPNRTQQNVQPFASENLGNNQIPQPLPNRTQQNVQPFASDNLVNNQIPQPLPNRTQQNVQPFASENLGNNQIHQPPQAFQPPHLTAPAEMPNITTFQDSPMPVTPLPEHIAMEGRNLVHSGMLGFDQRREIVKTQRTIDEEWLGQFLTGVQRMPQVPGINEKPMLIPPFQIHEGKRVIREYLELLSRLEKCRDNLANCLESDEVAWQQECSRANEIKAQLLQVQCQLKDASFVPLLLQTIAKKKKKRESIARRKMREHLAREDEQDRKYLVNEKIDAILAKEQKAIEDAKNEAALQKEVDNTLFEVKKKKHDADKTLEMLRALRKLRNLRKEAAAKIGVYTAAESDKNFEESVSKLEVLMNKARRTYLEEQQTLMVMLEEEHEENRERQMELLRQRQRDIALKAVQRKKELLFSKVEQVGPEDPLFPFQQFYSQAENNLHSLVEIRKQWDSFLVPPDDPAGSGIPTDWVIPTEPTSIEWASVLQDT